MIGEEITPLFTKMMSSDFTDKLGADLDVEAFSVEGDELPPIPVPLYHRGQAHSRKFSSWAKTGGSPARKAFMHIAIEHVSSKTKEILTKNVRTHIRRMSEMWLDISSFLCTCATGLPSIACCAGRRRPDLDFLVEKNNMQYSSWEISDSVLADIFDDIANSNTISDRWLHPIGSPVALNEEQRSIVTAAQLFASAGNVPVHTYGTQNGLAVLNNESLWEWCTGRISERGGEGGVEGEGDLGEEREDQTLTGSHSPGPDCFLQISPARSR